MNDEPRRRRRTVTRSSLNGPRQFPVWVLFPVVILAGLGIGAIIARSMGARPQSTTTTSVALTSPAAQTPSPDATPSPVPTAAPTATSSPQPTSNPRPTASAEPTQRPTARPTRTPEALPTSPPPPEPTRAASTVAPSATPQTRRTLPIARRVASTDTGPAVAVVRAYLDDLRRGDYAGASQFLASGDPSETFVDENAHVGAIESRRLSDGTVRVTADVRTASGPYVLTFTVDSSDIGQRILEHSATKM